MFGKPVIAALAAGCMVAAGAALTATAAAGEAESPVGIVSADPSESAAVLAHVQVTGHKAVGGYDYTLGTMDGHPVVVVAGGEISYNTVLATTYLDTAFRPRANLWLGTSGADAADLHVGDVVVGGYVIDKTNVHYHLASEHPGSPSTFQTTAGGPEMNTAPPADISGDVIAFRADATHVFVSAFAGNAELAALAARAPAGTTTLASATGDPSRAGTIRNKVITGVCSGSNPIWTEPLSQIAAQDALYPHDTEADEDPGFAFASQEAGVPFADIRVISDTPWQPRAFDGKGPLAHGAAVVRYVVDHLGATVDPAPVTMADLSPSSNARQAGYLIAGRAYYDVTPVTRIDAGGVTVPAGRLRQLLDQYAYGKDGL